MEFREITYAVEDHIVTVTLNRPQKLNAFTRSMGEEMKAALLQAKDDPSVKAVVITGAGRAFSSGANVKDLLDSREFYFHGARSDLLPDIFEITDLAINMEKPIIAAINGPCVGGGMELANMCDIRIASEQARFGMVFARMGTIPSGGGLYTLPRLVGLPKAMELLWTGRLFDTEEALRIGYVNRVAPHEELMSITHELAVQIARGPSLAIGAMKRLGRRFLEIPWSEAKTLHEDACVELGKTEDAHEGPLAYLEKREPLFKGR